jgi:uncharacterized protein YjeT (DUF2065 family)
MVLEWSDLAGALALLLVIEGLLPFANPAGMKRTMARVAALGERELRIAGLGSMLVGLVLLYFVRA